MQEKNSPFFPLAIQGSWLIQAGGAEGLLLLFSEEKFEGVRRLAMVKRAWPVRSQQGLCVGGLCIPGDSHLLGR